jgi:thymidylate synthase (FAD)
LAEETITYCARVSAPDNQKNFETAPKLLRYCIKKKHWSIFQMANMCVEINTTRDISAQFIRHRSISVQEFSTRYQDAGVLGDAKVPQLRKQDLKNRQNSTNDLDSALAGMYSAMIQRQFNASKELYDIMIESGVAKECARGILPLVTPTRLYANADIRSWITYIALREKNGTQLEHQDLALKIKEIFCRELPVISEALGGEDQWEI